MMRVPKLHKSLEGLEFTFDKCLVAPGNETNFLEKDIAFGTQLSEYLMLNSPIVSAAMDTVCEADAGIALALHGGIGVVHFNFGENLDSNIARQLSEVNKVKRYEGGFVEKPVTLSPGDLVDTAARIRERQGISIIPITEDGSPNGKVVGIIGKDDYSMSLHAGMPIKERMTPLEKLVTVTWEELESSGNPLETANKILLESKKSSVPVLDNQGNLKCLVTRSDIEKQNKFPYATRDENKRLRILISLETRHDRALPRVEAIGPYCDGFVIDSAHGFFKPEYELIKIIKQKFPNKTLVAGNVSMPDAVQYLFNAGADCVRIGTGPGGGCKTWDTAGTGREQVSAIVDCAYTAHELAKKRPFFINADGGIAYSGDIVISLAAGAHTVTLGELLAAAAESPGQIEIRGDPPRKMKKYRGMGSLEAMEQGGSHRYEGGRVPEGGVKYLDYRGSLHEWIPYLVQGVRQGMFKTGCKTVNELHEKAMLIYADRTAKRTKAKFEG